MDKEQDLKFIKGFAKIKIKAICARLKIHNGNIWTGKASAENIRRVKEEIQKEYLAINEQ